MKDTIIKTGGGLLVGAAIAAGTLSTTTVAPTYEKRGEKIEISRTVCVPSYYSGTPAEIQGWITILADEQGFDAKALEARRMIKARLQEDLAEANKIK